ncbi:MAG: hypothetical protein JJU45_13210 [Acidimicrobiia bacterium]|nr:hypothetical protein [Acidimicrobiia bacterium]
MVPDVRGLARAFDYLVPPALDADVRVGTVVRIVLHGRRVRGWVVADDVEPPPGVTLRPLAKVTGWGPTPEEVALTEWAAWRWAGPRSSLLAAATPERAVPSVPVTTRPRSPSPPTAATTTTGLAVADVVRAAAAHPVSTVRVPPAVDPLAVVEPLCHTGPVVVVAPTHEVAAGLGVRLRRGGVPVAVLPRGWPDARAGGVSVVGARLAAWAPCPEAAAIVVLDEHDEAHQEERTPTWHARDVAVERARRAGVPCVLVSPMPSLEAGQMGPVHVLARRVERSGWPIVDVVDQRSEDPTKGLLGERLVAAVRDGRRVVCVVNRTGRARLVACVGCGRVGECERCGAAVVQPGEGVLECRRCGTTRPVVCLHCHRTRFKLLRRGVSRLREELEVLAGEPVVEITASTDAAQASSRVVVGTEAALHRVERADVVAFLDFDQELLAPRYRAATEALTLLVRAGRVVGGRGSPGAGRVLVQTRLPQHEAISAAVLGDPTRLDDVERERRAMLGFPPAKVLAEISGPSAETYTERLAEAALDGVELLGPADGRWLLRAPTHTVLCDALAAVPRPPGRLRVAVDPLRV